MPRAQEPRARESLSKGARWLGVVWIVASLAHAVAGFVWDELPAWKMFRRLDRYEYRLFDRDGERIDLRDYVMRRAYLTQLWNVPILSRWVAETFPERTPFAGRYRVWREGQIIEVDFEVRATDTGSELRVVDSRAFVAQSPDAPDTP